MAKERVEGGKAGGSVLVAHPCVVENQHLAQENVHHGDDDQ